MIVEDDTALVSAIANTDNGIASGSVYLFTRDSTNTWNQLQKLTPSDGADSDNFGSSVSIAGELAIIAAIFDDNNGTNSGSAYIFSRDSTNSWSQQQKLTASDGNANDFLGVSVSISGNLAKAGARGNNSNGIDSGAAYIFTQDSTGTWSQQQKLLPNDNASGDLFGVASFISDNTVLVGASGSTYVFGPAPSLVFINGRWTMISLSKNPGASNSVQDFFNSALDPSDYIAKWVVYERDESTESYVMLGLSSGMQQGKGYWVLQVTGEDVGLSPAGMDTPVTL